jgi:hypothetical protein
VLEKSPKGTAKSREGEAAPAARISLRSARGVKQPDNEDASCPRRFEPGYEGTGQLSRTDGDATNRVNRPAATSGVEPRNLDEGVGSSSIGYFTGVLRKQNDRLCLFSGGISVEVLVSPEAQGEVTALRGETWLALKNIVGQAVTLTGRQVGDRIVGVQVRPNSDVVGGPKVTGQSAVKRRQKHR